MSQTHLGSTQTAVGAVVAQLNGWLVDWRYLIRRLQDYGIRDVFGIPGDYVLGFTAMLETARSTWSAARARTAPDSPPMPTPGSTAWARCA